MGEHSVAMRETVAVVLSCVWQLILLFTDEAEHGARSLDFLHPAGLLMPFRLSCCGEAHRSWAYLPLKTRMLVNLR